MKYALFVGLFAFGGCGGQSHQALASHEDFASIQRHEATIDRASHAIHEGAACPEPCQKIEQICQAAEAICDIAADTKDLDADQRCIDAKAVCSTQSSRSQCACE